VVYEPETTTGGHIARLPKKLAPAFRMRGPGLFASALSCGGTWKPSFARSVCDVACASYAGTDVSFVSCARRPVSESRLSKYAMVLTSPSLSATRGFQPKRNRDDRRQVIDSRRVKFIPGIRGELESRFARRLAWLAHGELGCEMRAPGLLAAKAGALL
jgi:hypothetical protein